MLLTPQSLTRSPAVTVPHRLKSHDVAPCNSYDVARLVHPVVVHVQTWPPGIQQLLGEARTDADDLWAGRAVRRAEALSSQTGLEFARNSFPMYFTGAFESKTVLVHLNGKLSDQLTVATYLDFDEYVDKHRRFGFHHWQQDLRYHSPFDQKQVRFLRPFGTIKFLPVSDPSHSRTNPARGLDCKLQLELIPYASPTFEQRKFTSEVLAPHFQRVLNAIAAYPRNYVIFCGSVFDRLLAEYEVTGSREDFHFGLPTTKGMSASKYRFSNVMFRAGDSLIQAGIAQSFAKQGIPMDAYGAKCHELYRIKQ